MKTTTKQQAIKKLGLRSYYQLAKHLKISEPAISQWVDGVVPMTSYVRLHVMHPDLFPMPTEKRK